VPQWTPTQEKAWIECLRAAWAARKRGQEVATGVRPAQWNEWDRKLNQETAAQESTDWWRRLAEACAPVRPRATGSGIVWPDDRYADDPRYGITYPPVPAPNLGEYDQREADYLEVCAAGTGEIIPDAAYESARERRAEMDGQTIDLARALECRGDKFVYGQNSGNRCTVVCVFSGVALPLPPVRRVSILPSIAAQLRSRMLRDIEHFISCRPTNSRMFTITSGPRVPQSSLRQEVSAFHRKLSKWNSGKVFRRFRLCMQWRATEFGSMQWDPETGQPTWHLHAHVLVTEDRPLSRRQRRLCRTALWRLLKVHWDDAGAIENPREFVKYPVKPGDLRRLTQEGGNGALFEFYQQTKGLHLTQPMSELRRVRAARKSKARRLVRMPVVHEGSILVEKADWNAGSRPLKDQTNRRAYLKRLAENGVPISRKEQDEAESAPNGRQSGQSGTGFGESRTEMDSEWDRKAELNRGGNGAFPAENGTQTARNRKSKRETNGIESADLETEWDQDSGGDGRPKAETGGGKSGENCPKLRNRIVARLAPAPYGGPVLEPAVVVWGYTGDLNAIRSDPRAAAIIAANQPAWDAAQSARALRVPRLVTSF